LKNCGRLAERKREGEKDKQKRHDTNQQWRTVGDLLRERGKKINKRGTMQI
jgi:hypothetical protein